MHEEGGWEGIGGRGGSIVLPRSYAAAGAPIFTFKEYIAAQVSRSPQAGDGVGYAGKGRRSRVTAKKYVVFVEDKIKESSVRHQPSQPHLLLVDERGNRLLEPNLAIRSDPVPRGVGHERGEALDSPNSVARLRHPALGRGRLGGLGEAVMALMEGEGPMLLRRKDTRWHCHVGIREFSSR